MNTPWQMSLARSTLFMQMIITVCFIQSLRWSSYNTISNMQVKYTYGHHLSANKWLTTVPLDNHGGIFAFHFLANDRWLFTAVYKMSILASVCILWLPRILLTCVKNVHMTTATSIKVPLMCPIQHVKQFCEMITQSCKDAQSDPLSNGSNSIEEKRVYLGNMMFALE